LPAHRPGFQKAAGFQMAASSATIRSRALLQLRPDPTGARPPAFENRREGRLFLDRKAQCELSRVLQTTTGMSRSLRTVPQELATRPPAQVILSTTQLLTNAKKLLTRRAWSCRSPRFSGSWPDDPICKPALPFRQSWIMPASRCSPGVASLDGKQLANAPPTSSFSGRGQLQV